MTQRVSIAMHLLSHAATAFRLPRAAWRNPQCVKARLKGSVSACRIGSSRAASVLEIHLFPLVHLHLSAACARGSNELTGFRQVTQLSCSLIHKW
ncbi:hypothetical protein EJ02DRAFT_256032 [Clathrospora elynae]|uniref:Uncharacterized protein n=1 Tax=Clathrospora elynae TaxID=706981 RepID=A0A6A5SLR2_9PLEO|nr:hypothetical protein EJ02DRAFT_256032 [Clathrospora elynae]